MGFLRSGFDSAAFDIDSGYGALLASHAPGYVVLLEVQPMEPLRVWTAAGGGLTNTYSCAFSTQIATSIIAGGIYRRLDDVRQNSTVLTSRASAALVDANLGSYFHDTAANRLYVSTTTGANPETFALVGAWFTLFFSSTQVSFSDLPVYWPILTGPLPTLTGEMPDPLFGAQIAEEGSVSLLNGDGLFDRLSRLYVWRNKKATFKAGGTALGYADFATVTTLRINSWLVNDELATLALESTGRILNVSLPTRTWGDGTITGAVSEEGALGMYQPLLFGSVSDCPLTKTGTLSNGRYNTVDATAQPNGVNVTAVYAVNRTTQVRTTLSPSDYVVGASGFTVTITGAYPSDTYSIRADLTDLVTSNTFGYFVYRLLQRCGEDASNIDVSALTSLATSLPQSLGLYLREAMVAADVLRIAEQSVLAQVFIAEDGRWTARPIDPSLPADFSLADQDFAAWDPEDPLTAVLNEVRVQYNTNPATGDSDEASSSEDFIRYGSETTDTHQIPSYLRSSADASALAHHLRFLKGSPAAMIRFEERGVTLMGARVGDLVAVTRARATVARTGAYIGHLLRLIRIEKVLGPDAPIVRGVLSDLDGQTDAICRCLGAAVDLNWSAASDEQKALYGFCGDANRYIDSTDPLTRDLKVGW